MTGVEATVESIAQEDALMASLLARPLTSPSGQERADLCLASEALPHVISLDIDPAANKGSVLHSYLCDVSNLGRAEALERVPPEFVEMAASIDVSRLPACEPESYAAEVSFGYHVDLEEGRELGRGKNRDYSGLGPREIGGQLDVVGLASDSDAVVVADYKTGFRRLTEPRYNWQLLSYALMASRAYGRSAAIVRLIRLREDGTSYPVSADLSSAELEAHAERLRELADRIEDARIAYARGDSLRLVEGDHCRYCPAFASCPAKGALLRSLSREGSVLAKAELTAQDVAAAWPVIHAAELAIARAKKMVAEFVDRTPVTLASGNVLGIVPVPREVCEPDVALPVLEELYGLDVAFRATSREVSKASIRRALTPWVEQRRDSGARITHVMEQALTAIRERRGFTVKMSYPMRELPPAPAPADAPASLPAPSSELSSGLPGEVAEMSAAV